MPINPYATLAANPFAGSTAVAATGKKAKKAAKPKLLKPKQIEKQLLNERYQRQLQMYPQLLGQLGNLQFQANANPYEQVATLAAPRYQQAGDYFRTMQSNLGRTLADTGLDSSSFAGSAYGALAGQQGAAQADIYGDVMGTVRDEQQDAQDRLLSLLYQLSTGEADASAAISGRRLDRRAAMQAQDQGGFFDDLFGGLFGLGGAVLGNPGIFGSGRRR